MNKKWTKEQTEALYWRHKKSELGESDKNGEVKVTKLPHPLKCSKCDYIAVSVADSKIHWLDH